METIFLTGMRNNILTSSFLPDPSLFRYHHDLKFCMFVISGIPFPSHFLLQTTPFLLKAWVSLQSLKMEGLKVSLVLFSFSSHVFLLSFLPQKCLPFQSLLWALYAPLPVIITVGLNYNFCLWLEWVTCTEASESLPGSMEGQEEHKSTS